MSVWRKLLPTFLLLFLQCWRIGSEVRLISDYFCAFVFKTLGLYLANSLSLTSLFPLNCFLSPQLEFLIEETWHFKLLISPLLKLFIEGRYSFFFLEFLIFLLWVRKLALTFRPELKLDIFPRYFQLNKLTKNILVIKRLVQDGRIEGYVLISKHFTLPINNLKIKKTSSYNIVKNN